MIQYVSMTPGNDVLMALLQKLTDIADDHEKRIRWLERGASMALGALVLVQFIFHK